MEGKRVKEGKNQTNATKRKGTDMSNTSFLEFVAERLLGPPASREGESALWRCPRCQHRRWHIRPPKPGFKVKFACWRPSCAWWGDELDLLAYFEPTMTYTEQCDLLAEWREAFDRGDSPTFFSPRGSGPKRGEPANLEEVFQALTPSERSTLVSARAILRDKAGWLPFDSLAAYCSEREAERREAELQDSIRRELAKDFPLRNGKPRRPKLIRRIERQK
jgi:hypothetical protein